MITTLLVSKWSAVYQQNWLVAMQKRLAITARTVGSLKAVRMLGIESRIADKIQALRVDEIQISKAFRNLLIVTVFLCKSIPSFESNFNVD